MGTLEPVIDLMNQPCFSASLQRELRNRFQDVRLSPRVQGLKLQKPGTPKNKSQGFVFLLGLRAIILPTGRNTTPVLRLLKTWS